MPLRAEFDFKKAFVTQQQGIQWLQRGVALLLALLIYYLSNDLILLVLLELTLLLVFFRAQRGFAKTVAIECLLIHDKKAEVLIEGSHYTLAICRLAYASSRLALVRLATVAGQDYYCFVSPGLLGSARYRQLLALLQASPELIANEPD